MEAIVRSESAEIVAIADPDLKAAGTAQDLAPGAVVRRGLGDLLAEEIDGVVIATPTALHVEDAIEALRRGVAVFCQQPLGRHAGEVRQIVDAARTANRLLGVDTPYRCTEGVQQIRSLIRSGALGHVYAANVVCHSANAPEKAWYADPGQSGGGCMLDLGSHLVDLVLWALDFPDVTSISSQLLAEGRPLRSPTETAEDFAAAQIMLSQDRVVQLACSWKLQTGCDLIVEASFYGTRGGAAIRHVDGASNGFVAERFTGTTRQHLSTSAEGWDGGAAADWTRRLAIDASFDPTVERVIGVAETIDRIRRSDRT